MWCRYFNYHLVGIREHFSCAWSPNSVSKFLPFQCVQFNLPNILGNTRMYSFTTYKSWMVLVVLQKYYLDLSEWYHSKRFKNLRVKFFTTYSSTHPTFASCRVIQIQIDLHLNDTIIIGKITQCLMLFVLWDQMGSS